MTEPSRLILGVGYLGRRLAERWKATPGQVFGTTRRRDHFPKLTQLGPAPIAWDVLAGGDPLPAVETVVYAVGFDPSASSTRADVYVDGLRRTLEQLPRPGRFLYVSSTGVYGDHQGDWVDESTLPAPTDPGGQACLEAENLIRDFASQRGWDVVILRFAGIYGPGRLINLERLKRGEPIAGDPEGWVNLIHVEDGAGILALAETKARPGETYLVSDGEPVRRRDFYQYLAEKAGLESPRFDPGQASRHRGNRRVSNRKLLAELAPNFAYPSFREGLRVSLESEG